MLIKFLQLVEQETRDQAETPDLIQSEKCRELVHDKIWVPNILLEYHDFKVMLDEKEKEEKTKMTKMTRKERRGRRINTTKWKWK
jgi:hypothetical protein